MVAQDLSGYMYMYVYMMTWDGRKKERKTDTWGNEKMKNELPQVGFEPTTLCTLDRCSMCVCVCVCVCIITYYRGNIPFHWFETYQKIH